MRLFSSISELLKEIRLAAEAIGLSKLDVLVVYFLALLFWRLPAILKCYRDWRALHNDFALKQKKLSGKLDKERKRRVKKKDGD